MEIRSQFPALTKRINNTKIVYLDSAATSLKPWSVIERIGHFYTYETANVHRGAHAMANEATLHYEDSRQTVAQFLNCDPQEVVFTKGTTDSINLIAHTYASLLTAQDEILISEMEHHSNLVPWQVLSEKTGAKLRYISVSQNGDLDLQDAAAKLSGKTKIVAITYVSNSLGTINPIKEVIRLAHAVGAKVLVDAAQAVSLLKVDVKDFDIDYLAFSAHKLYGPYGVGVLFGKSALLNALPPFETGGSMIEKVSFDKTTYLQAPQRFEAGTPNIGGVIALKPAIEFVQKVGLEAIKAHADQITNYAVNTLSEIPKLKFVGTPTQRGPIVSFVIEGCHAADVGQILDEQGIAVRVGHHCTQPILNKLGQTSTIRASFGVYTDNKDIDSLKAGLLKAISLL